VPQQRGSITLPVKGNGIDLMSLAALMIAAPVDAQATRKARAVRKSAGAGRSGGLPVRGLGPLRPGPEIHEKERG